LGDREGRNKEHIPDKQESICKAKGHKGKTAVAATQRGGRVV
jgi:hypothetical protein